MAKRNVIGISSRMLTLEAAKLAIESDGKILSLNSEEGIRVASFAAGTGVSVFRADLLQVG